MKKLIPVVIMICIVSCNNGSKNDAARKQDSIVNASDKKVEHIIQNDDSLIKAKEKELLEKYK